MAYLSDAHRTGKLVLQFLDTVGNGGTDIQMNVDGSVTPQVFKLVCPTGYVIQLESIAVFIKDSSPFTVNKYGKLPTLTNGMLIEYTNGTKVTDVTSQLAIKSNGDWLAYALESRTTDFGGGKQLLSAEYNFSEHGKSLRLSAGDEYRVTVRDNLTGLLDHYIKVSFVMAKLSK